MNLDSSKSLTQAALAIFLIDKIWGNSRSVNSTVKIDQSEGIAAPAIPEDRRGSSKKFLQALTPLLALVLPHFFSLLFARPQLPRAWNRLPSTLTSHADALGNFPFRKQAMPFFSAKFEKKGKYVYRHPASNPEPLLLNIPFYTTTLPGWSTNFPQNFITNCDFLKC